MAEGSSAFFSQAFSVRPFKKPLAGMVICGPDVSVTEVARRHGITRQHIYQWRSDMRRGRLVDEMGGPLLAVEFVGGSGNDRVPPEEPCGDGLIEIALRKGRVLRAPASIAPGVLTALIRAAEAA